MASQLRDETDGGQSGHFQCLLTALVRNLDRDEAHIQIGLTISCEDFMVIEFNEEETRLLYNILVEHAAEHLSYANPSELTEKLYQLARRFERSVTTESIHIA